MSADVSPAFPDGEKLAVPTARLGMWLFLASEIMFFTGLIGSYIVLRLGSGSWPDPNEILAVPVLAINTFVLVTSSVTMVKALQAIQSGDNRAGARFLLFTAGLGSLFLLIKLADYRHMIHAGFTPQASLFGSCYYTLTGFHGLHVLAGVVCLLLARGWALKGRFSAPHHDFVENIGLYWHFVDLVWIVLFAILCLV